MEETLVPKRPREEETQLKEDYEIFDFEQESSSSSSSSKRHKPYSHILSLLETEETEEAEDPTQQDLSPLITTLQQEIFTNSPTHHDSHQNNGQHNNNLSSTTTTKNSLEEESTNFANTTHSNGVLDAQEDKDGVMRHLLEASDDELGIPNRSGELLGEGSHEDFGENGFIGDMFSSSICDDGLFWELEDETANYYALLQSELFL